MSSPAPIAIVGAAGLFPGAADLDAFWSLIGEARSAAAPIPAERVDADVSELLAGAHGVPDRMVSPRACLLPEFDVDDLADTLRGRGLDPGRVGRLDPLYRLVLRVGADAWADAGSVGDLDRAGVVLANIALPTDGASELARAVAGRAFEERVLGLEAPKAWEDGLGRDPLDRFVTALPAALLARALGFGGGSWTLDAACASSLYAVHLACEELRAGRLDVALAGGASRPDCLYTQIGFSQLHALSPSGTCAPFDQRADGLVVGEGAGMFVLKRLDRALEDGDRIRAVIRGAGLSNDLGGSLLSPETEGQVRAMRAAYRGLDVGPGDVDLVECHGTGTPRGDTVELTSLRALHDGVDRDRPVILGSVKSNVGHLLTGAAAAGLMKVLLALERGVLPPSAGYDPQRANPALGDRFEVLDRPRPWPQPASGPRTAAVSAFGFGGINAHLVVQEWRGQRPAIEVRSREPAPVAIVGMGARVGSLTDLRAVREAGLRGDPVLDARPEHRWGGVERAGWVRAGAGALSAGMPAAWIDALEIPIGRFRLPPSELGSVLPQHLLLLQVADAAVRDAAGAWPDPVAGARLRAGCVVGLGLDLETTRFHLGWALPEHARAWARQLGLQLSPTEEARWVEGLRGALGPALDAGRVQGALGGMIASRVARELRLGGPCFAVSDEDGSGLRALQTGVRMIQRGEVDEVLVGAVDLGGDVTAALADDARRPWSRSGRALPMDARADGPVVGEGAAAVVLKSLERALADGDRVYAVVRGVGAASGGGVFEPGSSVGARRAAEAAWREARCSPTSAGLVEVHASGTPEADARELAGLAPAFAGGAPTALSASKGVYGETGATAGLLSAVRAASALHGRVLPPTPGFRSARAALPEGLHVPCLPQPWHHDAADGPRRAGVSSVSVGGTSMHVVLEEAPRGRPDPASCRPLGDRGVGLFVVDVDPAGPRGAPALRRFADARRAAPIEELAAAWWTGRESSRGATRAVVAGDVRELTTRLTRLAGAPPPITFDGGVAWVFPGSGNHYLGMGRDVALGLPGVLRAIDAETRTLRGQLRPERFGPWRADWPEGWEAIAEAALLEDPRCAIFGQVAHGITMARVLQAFGVTPKYAIGYSLGESAALFATGAWSDRDGMYRRVMESPLFGSELAGERTLAVAAWGAADWWPVLIERPADVVVAALADLGGDESTTARLLITNAPAECVVGGRRADVEALCVRLAVTPFPLPGVPTVHCDLVGPVADRYRELHLLPTDVPPGVRFYSGCWGRSFELTEASAADSIVANALHGLDFPATVERAYADGARVFVEAGPQGSCARMISSILGDRPHVAVSACRKGRTGMRNLLDALAACVDAGVPVALDVLYGEAGGVPALASAPPARVVRVPLGRTPAPLPPSPAAPMPTPRSPAAPASVAPASLAPEVGTSPITPPVAGGSSRPAVVGSLPAASLPTATLAASPLESMVALSSAHAAFLQVSSGAHAAHAAALTLQQALVRELLERGPAPPRQPAPPAWDLPADGVPRSLDRARCMEFAVGSLGAVLGPRFAEVDSYPTRVRLPDEPLMFVDRILSIEGEPGSLGPGRCVTEHDVLPGAWYLDGGRVPVCVSVEAGQADLFLSAFLGIDAETKGERVYRLLDAQVVFHRDLPAEGDVIRYDIHIDRFIRQGSTWLFFFRFEGWIGDSHLISMQDGCAGFFTPAQLAGGRGIVDPSAKPPEGRRRDASGALTAAFSPLVEQGVPRRIDAAGVDALRRGDLEGAFGPAFAGRSLHHGLHLPGGRMALIDRVVELDPAGGSFGLGTVSTEWDVDPRGWYLTCHFIDDQVMPGTFMYEGCLHTLRVLLLRLGWIAPADPSRDLHYAPIPEIPSRLRCRGQVTEHTRCLQYRLDIKEIGYDPEPYVLADALMYGDGRCIVQFENVSYRLSGVERAEIEQPWRTGPVDASPFGPPRPGKPALYDRASILAFATGAPSEAFGEPYAVFDRDRRIARLPGPPLCFLDRVTELEPAPWVLEPSGWIEAEYDVPPDAWYFAANRQASMPFAILLETALQPCGWLAAYLGSALRSEQDLHFRNLSGTATLHAEIFPDVGTLTTRVRLTGMSEAASMILQEFDFQLWGGGRILYDGVTRFGFFPGKSLEEQVGIRGAAARAWAPVHPGRAFPVPQEPPLRPDHVAAGETPPAAGLQLPTGALCMLDRVDAYLPEGGPAGLGWIRGTKSVDPGAWFFAAHFHQDPVIPGSLGLEAFQQLLKIVARDRFPDLAATHRFEPIGVGREHRWLYRGQVIPTDSEESVEAVVTAVEGGDAPVITADGFLRVDGRIIYEMLGFTLRLVRAAP